MYKETDASNDKKWSPVCQSKLVKEKNYNCVYEII